nr:immunoglobulin heavy chain junction region [Macaca mulatta]MOY20547.1 immunoglobulin heavy chain junction region [Macaca mulatta]
CTILSEYSGTWNEGGNYW